MVYSYKQVNEAAKGRWTDILSRIGFSSVHLNGKSGVCPNCSTSDGNRFQFTDVCKAQPLEGQIGWAYCRGCESGSGWHWLEKMTNLKGQEAYKFIADILGVPELHAKGSGSGFNEYIPSEIISPAPKQAFDWVDQKNKKINFYNKKLKSEYPSRFYQRQFVYVLPYYDDKGKVIGLASRFELRDGTKITPMLAWQRFENGDCGWSEHSFEQPKFLFGLQTLQAAPDNAVVYIVEGEKCQKRLSDLIKEPVITWTCGAKSWKTHDWSILQDKELVFIPDLDQRSKISKGKLGYEVMLDIAKHLGKPFRAIIFKNMDRRHGYDVADAIDDGLTADQFKVLVKRSEVYNPDDERLRATAYPLTEDDEPIIRPEPIIFAEKHLADLEPSNGHYRELGFDGEFFYFYIAAFRGVKWFKREGLTDGAILQMAPLEYWQAVFPKRSSTGFDLTAIKNDIIQGCARRGNFDMSRIRRRGVYFDKNRVIVNLGDRLVVDGITTDYLSLDSNYVYISAPAIKLDLTAMATEKEADLLLKCLLDLNLGSESEAYLLLGWLTLAGVGAALNWRPHMWLNASFQSGKSWLLNHVVVPILGDFCIKILGGTTEAFIRQQQGDNLAIIFDESEAKTPSSKLRMDGIFELMRNSSTDSPFIVGKGSKDNRAVSFTIKSMFLFSSISFAPSGAADRSRITNINLKPKEAKTQAEIEAKAAHFKELKKKISELKLEERGQRFLARAIYNIRLINYNKAVMIQAIEKLSGHRRLADQYGSLLAGAWTMLYERELDLEMAEAWIVNTDLHITDYEQTVTESDELDILQVLLQHEVFINRDHGSMERLTVGQCLERIKNADLSSDSMLPIKETLAAKGIKYQPHPMETSNKVYIARRSPALSSIFQYTAAQNNWEVYLKRLPFAEKSLSDPVHFSTSLGGSQRAIVLNDSFIADKRIQDS
jgi:putative DNA primase/helicase